MDTIHDEVARSLPPLINFNWTPKQGPFVMNFGGNVYPWALNRPQAGAPGQAGVFYTHTEVELTFTADVVPAPGDTILEYYWDFGDGTEGYGPIVKHTYHLPSSQARASLCVTDSQRRRFCVGRQLLLQAAQKVVLTSSTAVEDTRTKEINLLL